MLSNDHFYFNSLRRYVIAFSHIINDIHVFRTDSEGVLTKDIRIPISYGQKSKLFYYLERNSNIGRKIDTFLPRIDFEITSIEPDSTRQKNAVHLLSILDTDDINYTHNAVAYNINFEVNLITNYLDDLYQALEQCLAVFNPDYTMQVSLIDELEIAPKIKTVLTGVDLDINQDLTDEDFRSCTGTFEFKMYGYLFKPIQTFGKIKKVIANLTNFDTDKIWTELTSELKEDETIEDSSTDYEQFL